MYFSRSPDLLKNIFCIPPTSLNYQYVLRFASFWKKTHIYYMNLFNHQARRLKRYMINLKQSPSLPLPQPLPRKKITLWGRSVSVVCFLICAHSKYLRRKHFVLPDGKRCFWGFQKPFVSLKIVLHFVREQGSDWVSSCCYHEFLRGQTNWEGWKENTSTSCA